MGRGSEIVIVVWQLLVLHLLNLFLHEQNAFLVNLDFWRVEHWLLDELESVFTKIEK